MDDKEKKDSLFEKHRENQYFRWGLTAFLVIVAAIIAAQLITKLPALFSGLKAILKTLSSVLYGLVIAYLLHPIVDRVDKFLDGKLRKHIQSEKRVRGWSRGLGILTALVLAILLVWALLAMVLPELVDSIATIIGNLPSYYNTVSKWIASVIDDTEIAGITEGLMDQIYEYLTGFLKDSVLPKLQSLLTTVTTSVVGLAKSLVNLIIGVIISVYLLSGKERLISQAKKIGYAVLGKKYGGYVCNVCTYANRVFGGFIGGKLVDSLIIGILCFLGLSILDMPYTMLISVIVGVTNIIPFFGPYLGAIPSALLLLVIDPWKCLYFIIFILILQQIDGNIIGPLILGDATGLDSIWVVVSILLFGGLFGIVGMIIAVPLFAVIYKIISEVVDRLLEKRGLSTVTTDYQKWNYPPRPDPDRWNPSRKQRRKRKKSSETAGAEEETPVDREETSLPETPPAGPEEEKREPEQK